MNTFGGGGEHKKGLPACLCGGGPANTRNKSDVFLRSPASILFKP